MGRLPKDRTMQNNVVSITSHPAAIMSSADVFAQRIRFFRIKAGINQPELARRIGVGKNAVSNWEQGRSRPDISNIPVLCNALGITPSDLFESKGFTPTAREKKLIAGYRKLTDDHRKIIDSMIRSLLDADVCLRRACPKLRTIPLCPIGLVAGIGDPTMENESEETVYLHDIPEIDRADYAAYVNGVSMEPTFHDGQTVLIQKISQSEFRFGEIGAFEYDGILYIKEYRKDGLHSHNPAFETMRFSEGDEVRFLGKVIYACNEDQVANEEEIRLYERIHE